MKHNKKFKKKKKMKRSDTINFFGYFITFDKVSIRFPI